MIAELKDKHVPNGPLGGLPFNVGLPKLSQTWSSTSSFLTRRLKDLLPRLRLMQAPTCFQGPLIVLMPGDSRVPLGASSSASSAGASPFDSSTSVSRGPTSGF